MLVHLKIKLLKYSLIIIFIAAICAIFFAGRSFPETTDWIILEVRQSKATNLLNEISSWGVVAGAIIAFWILSTVVSNVNDRREDEITRAWSILAANPETKMPSNTGVREALELLVRLNKDTRSLCIEAQFLSQIDLGSRFSIKRRSFFGSSFRGSNMEGSKLSGFDFRFCDLSHCNFSFSDLSYCDFSFSDMTRVVMNGANLANTKFFDVNLDHGDLRGTDLRSARFGNGKYNNLLIDGCGSELIVPMWRNVGSSSGQDGIGAKSSIRRDVIFGHGEYRNEFTKHPNFSEALGYLRYENDFRQSCAFFKCEKSECILKLISEETNIQKFSKIKCPNDNLFCGHFHNIIKMYVQRRYSADSSAL